MKFTERFLNENGRIADGSPYTLDQKERLDRMLSGAALAEEMIDLDELEDHSKAYRKARQL